MRTSVNDTDTLFQQQSPRVHRPPLSCTSIYNRQARVGARKKLGKKKRCFGRACETKRVGMLPGYVCDQKSADAGESRQNGCDVR